MRDAEAIEVLGIAAGVGELVEANEIVAVLGQRVIDQAVLAGGRAVLGELPAGGVVQLQLGVEPAVDAAVQAADDDALPLLAGEDVVIDIGGGGDGAVDRGADLDPLGLLDVVVRLLLRRPRSGRRRRRRAGC